MRLYYESGTIVLDTALSPEIPLPNGACWDARIKAYRADAFCYRDWLTLLIRAGHKVTDEVRDYQELPLCHRRTLTPYDFQSEALAAWNRNGRRGVIVLPTGSGKTYVAELCIARAGRSTLVCVPTIDLLGQWSDRLASGFGDDIGMVGGGSYELRPLTVITYQSAIRHIDHLGQRFGLIIFDECHHLPSPMYAEAARGAIAPFRLGLTATYERSDLAHQQLDQLIGPLIYEKRIEQLAGRYLAEYRVVSVNVALDDEDRQSYQQNRQTYLAFLRRRGIRFNSGADWSTFIAESSRSKAGRLAFKAYREQRRIALCAPAKIRALTELLQRHRNDRIIIFTNDNETVYTISKTFLIPAITHRSPARERKEVLARFRDGRYPAVVTSRVLNEGVDVPDANVAIVMSGTSVVREQVQRLGRILRKREGKQALLYELITTETLEESVSERRRGDRAFR